LMHPDISNALVVQELDLHIAGLRKEIALLPRQIEQIERQLVVHTRQLEQDKAALASNARDRKALDGEIQVHRQKISKLKDQMMQAKTNEQYRAFQHEIEYCEKGIVGCEDRILELMLAAEPLETNVKKAEAALAEERKAVEAQKAEAKALTAADKAALERALGEREDAVKRVPAELLAVYERLRAKHKDGVAITEVAEGQCSACHMMVRPQLLVEVRSGTSVVACENCRRLLYVPAPPVDVAAEMQV
jgi:uncharacterized protein